MTNVDRINALVQDSVKAGFEAAEAAQQQNRALTEAWLGAFSAGQSIVRDFTVGSIERAQEAQRLWLNLLQETTQAGLENFTTVAQAGVAEAKAARANGNRVESAVK